VRVFGSQCIAPVAGLANTLDYLDTFPVNMDKYIQGALESPIITTNGVLDANRGDNDVISILIRRGREMGVPSFTDLREQVSVSPSGCAWDSWDATPGCDPATLFQADKLDGLKALYNSPQDVELIVGASLSIDRVSADYSDLLNAAPLDATQAYLLIGEIQRIINLDAFGITKCLIPGANSFYQRFKNDDPGSQAARRLSSSYPLNGFAFADGLIRYSKAGQAQLLIQANSGVKCIQKAVFIQGGFSQITNPAGVLNLMRLPFPNGPTQSKPTPGSGGQYFNCDIPADVFATFTDGFGDTYDDLFCQGDPRGPGCWSPELPFCV